MASRSVRTFLVQEEACKKGVSKMKKYDLNVKDENQFGKNLYNLRKAYGEKLEDILNSR